MERCVRDRYCRIYFQEIFCSCFNDVHKQCCFTVNVTVCHPELRQGSLPLLHECQACSDLEDWWFPGQQGITSLTQHFHIWKQDCFINKEKDKGKVEIKKRNVIKSVGRLVQENIWGTLWRFLQHWLGIQNTQRKEKRCLVTGRWGPLSAGTKLRAAMVCEIIHTEIRCWALQSAPRFKCWPSTYSCMALGMLFNKQCFGFLLSKTDIITVPTSHYCWFQGFIHADG